MTLFRSIQIKSYLDNKKITFKHTTLRFYVESRRPHKYSSYGPLVFRSCMALLQEVTQEIWHLLTFCIPALHHSKILLKNILHSIFMTNELLYLLYIKYLCEFIFSQREIIGQKKKKSSKGQSQAPWQTLWVISTSIK